MSNSNVGKPPHMAMTALSLINAVGSVGDFEVAHNYHSLHVSTGSGVSAGVVALQLSNDNVTWFSPASNTVTTSAANTGYMVTVGPIPARFARAVITTAITGGTINAFIGAA